MITFKCSSEICVQSYVTPLNDMPTHNTDPCDDGMELNVKFLMFC